MCYTLVFSIICLKANCQKTIVPVEYSKFNGQSCEWFKSRGLNGCGNFPERPASDFMPVEDTVMKSKIYRCARHQAEFDARNLDSERESHYQHALRMLREPHLRSAPNTPTDQSHLADESGKHSCSSSSGSRHREPLVSGSDPEVSLTQSRPYERLFERPDERPISSGSSAHACASHSRSGSREQSFAGISCTGNRGGRPWEVVSDEDALWDEFLNEGWRG